MHEHGCHGTASLVEARFDDDTTGRTGVRCFQFQHFGLQKQRLEQLVHTLTGFGGNAYEDRVAAQGLRNNLVSHQILLDPFRVRVRPVDLIHCDDHGNLRSTGVLDCFDSLRHDAIIGGHDQHDDVGHLGASCTHCGERGMTRCIEKSDHALVRLHMVGADVLRDAACFSLSHSCTANMIEQ